MTITTIVIALLSVFAHLRRLGPLQAITQFAYTVVRLKLSTIATKPCIKQLLQL